MSGTAMLWCRIAEAARASGFHGRGRANTAAVTSRDVVSCSGGGDDGSTRLPPVLRYASKPPAADLPGAATTAIDGAYHQPGVPGMRSDPPGIPAYEDHPPGIPRRAVNEGA